MPDGRWRVHILCEDRRAERFLRRLCERFEVRVDRVEVAPSGKGDASAWVLSRFPAAVAKRRSKNFQQFLGLVVHVDGDDVGFANRRRQLEQELEAPRSADEPVALMLPTWSIETWIAALCGSPGVTEEAPLKNKSPHRNLWIDGRAESESIRSAVQSWPGRGTLRSLDDSQAEAARVEIHPPR